MATLFELMSEYTELNELLEDEDITEEEFAERLKISIVILTKK